MGSLRRLIWTARALLLVALSASLGCAPAAPEDPDDPAPWQSWTLIPETLGEAERARAQAGVDRINSYRAAMGLAPVVLDERLTRAALNQARYNVTHQASSCLPAGLGAHEQVAGCEGFVAKTAAERAKAFGYTDHHVSECLGHEDATDGVTIFLESVYHRACVSSPHVTTVGYALEPAPWGFRTALEVAVDFDAGADKVARWPPPEHANAAASWSGFELPEPPKPPGGWPSGPVVGLSFAWRWQDDTTWTGATLHAEGQSAALPSVFYAPGEAIYLPSAFVYTHAPLSSGRYRVAFRGKRDGAPFEDAWSFEVK